MDNRCSKHPGPKDIVLGWFTASYNIIDRQNECLLKKYSYLVFFEYFLSKFAFFLFTDTERLIKSTRTNPYMPGNQSLESIPICKSAMLSAAWNIVFVDVLGVILMDFTKFN